MPGKNFRSLGEKPLFQWALDSLLSVPRVSKVVINTDARHVLEQHKVCDSERVRIRDRRAEICGDEISMNTIIADDLSAVDADIFLMTHTTSPFLSPASIVTAVETYEAGIEEGTADSLFSVTPMQTRFYRQDGSAVNHDSSRLIPTQALEPWFEENSALYVFSKQSFAVSGSRIGAKPAMFQTEKVESVDIDTEEDWSLAEKICAGLINESKRQR